MGHQRHGRRRVVGGRARRIAAGILSIGRLAVALRREHSRSGLSPCRSAAGSCPTIPCGCGEPPLRLARRRDERPDVRAADGLGRGILPRARPAHALGWASRRCIVVGFFFIRSQLREPYPILPFDLLRIPIFSVSVATSICSFLGQMLAMVALPFYLQHGLRLRRRSDGTAADGLARRDHGRGPDRPACSSSVSTPDFWAAWDLRPWPRDCSCWPSCPMHPTRFRHRHGGWCSAARDSDCSSRPTTAS